MQQVICDFAGAEVQKKCRGCGDAQAGYSESRYRRGRCRCRCAQIKRCTGAQCTGAQVQRYRGVMYRGIEVV